MSDEINTQYTKEIVCLQNAICIIEKYLGKGN